MDFRNLFLISPTALGFLPPLLLILVSLGHFFSRPKSKPTWFLIGWLLSMSAMLVSQFLAYTIYAPVSTIINWVGGTVPMLTANLFLIQFTYYYPRPIFIKEARRVLIISGLLIVGMIGLMVYEATTNFGTFLYVFEQFTYDMLSEDGRHLFTSPTLFVLSFVSGIAWAVIVRLRAILQFSTDNSPAQSWAHRGRQLGQALYRPPNQDAKTARAFAFHTSFSVVITVILVMEFEWRILPPGSFGVSYLFFLSALVLIYVNTSREPSTMMVKVIGITLMMLLTTLGMVNRFVGNQWVEQEEAHRLGEVTHINSLLSGSDDPIVPTNVLYLAERPFTDNPLSTQHQLILTRDQQITAAWLNAEDRQHQQGVTQNSVITNRALAYQLPSLDTDQLNQTSDNGQSAELAVDTVTRAYRGVYDRSTKHYLRYSFALNETLYEVGYSYLAYRQNLHKEMLPLAIITIGTTLLILFLFPLFFQTSLIRPLSNLLDGVQQIGQGNLQAHVPVGVDDEIGSLTRSFNQMAQSLHILNSSLYQEIGDRRQAEKTAQSNADRYRDLFENTPLCILEIGLNRPSYPVLQANQQAQQVYGWSLETLCQLSLRQLIAPKGQTVIDALVTIIDTGERVTVESVGLRHDGTTFPLRIHATPEQADIVGRMIVTIEDITIETQRRSEIGAIAEDRRRIARELHDSLAQTLVGLRFRTKLWQKWIETKPEQLHQDLDEARTVLDDSILEVRRSIFALRPINLDQLGFFPALRQLALDFEQQYHLSIQLNVQGSEEKLPEELELNLFRVIQESLNNVVKHANATAASITINQSRPNIISITIEDDGTGFDVKMLEDQVQSGHIGLKQMQERIESINGTRFIYSTPRVGTKLEITIPIMHKGLI